MSSTVATSTTLSSSDSPSQSNTPLVGDTDNTALIGGIVGGVLGLLFIVGAIVAAFVLGQRRGAAMAQRETEQAQVGSVANNYARIPQPTIGQYSSRSGDVVDYGSGRIEL